jgi:hypothetical protein
MQKSTSPSGSTDIFWTAFGKPLTQSPIVNQKSEPHHPTRQIIIKVEPKPARPGRSLARLEEHAKNYSRPSGKLDQIFEALDRILCRLDELSGSPAI